MNFKETLCLPKTDFSMRANLPEREPAVYKKWADDYVYNRMDMNRLGAKTFTLHDGPPYANGDIHVGTAMNKILKDFIIKHRYFNGAHVYWKPGWDCHGLPIERGATSEPTPFKRGPYGSVQDLEAAIHSTRRTACRKYADKFVYAQMEQFQQLGIVADWDRPYRTDNKEFEAEIYHKLCMLAKDGLLYERLKPVLWSWKEQTALASAEVVYKDHECTSMYVAMPTTAFPPNTHPFQFSRIIIWTTTPWTLPANVAVALHPDEKYVLTTENNIVAEKRFSELKKQGVLKEGEEKKGEFTAKQFEKEIVYNPLRECNMGTDDEFNSKIVFSRAVDMNTGTGCVHIAPGHGEVDYEIGIQNKLPVIMPVDEHGRYTKEIEEIIDGFASSAEMRNSGPWHKKHNLLYAGLHVLEANDVIAEILEDQDCLLKSEKITHSYPFCERSGEPAIFRATKQWFIKMKDLREKALAQIKGVKFTPESGRQSLDDMVRTRPDWCISRQRSWGVPIAFFRHKRTGKYLLGDDVLNHIEKVFKKHSSDAWFTMETKDLLPKDYRYKPEDVEKVMDVLDVWFDSGSTWQVLGSYKNGGKFPADLYLEGRDQHRGWFSSSLLLATACAKQRPFRAVVTHGFVTDGLGHKMAKSVGNVIAPADILKSHGAEILRMWVATSDTSKDLRISTDILDSVKREYDKLRNTFRFLLGNLGGYKQPLHSHLKPLDDWICDRARKTLGEVNDLFFQYQFAKGMHKLMDFVHHDLSGLYMNAIKDRMYCGSAEDRLGGQEAMALILRAMIGLLAPILTFTCDEVLKHIDQQILAQAGLKDVLPCADIFDFPYFSVPNVEGTFPEPFAKDIISKLHGLTDQLKQDGKLKNPLELIVVGPNFVGLGGITNETMEEWLVVSAYINYGHPSLRQSPEKLGELKVDASGLFSDRKGEVFEVFEVYRSNMKKCPRCWKHNVVNTELCNRCTDVIKNEHTR